MKFSRLVSATPLLASVLLVVSSFAAAASPGWAIGIGVSELTDPAAAGDEAAGLAKDRLGGVPAKFVMVAAAEPQVTQALLDGVTKHFAPAVVYGCQVTSPLTPDSNFPDAKILDIPVGVGILAIGGDMDVAAFSSPTDSDAEDVYYSAGVALGEMLRPTAEGSKRPGKLILTFGDQYTGSNADFIAGFADTLEGTYPMIGGAAGNITAKVIAEGRIVTGVNVGVFIGGEFKVGQAMNGGTHTPETADKTLDFALSQGEGEEPFFAFIFNCRRRRIGMMENNQLAEELATMRNRLPHTPFFGFYGPGEVGAAANGERPKGVGFTVASAILFPR